MKRLDLQVTERARAWISHHLSSYEPGSVLALTNGSLRTYAPDGKAKDEASTRWRFVVFTRAQADQIESTSHLTGEGVYETTDGIALCIAERQDLERLSGKTLDAVNDALVVYDRAN
jgi:hypothetical protein